MKEYDRFEKGAANSNTSTTILKRQLENPEAHIIITTIQKLATFIKKNPGHEAVSYTHLSEVQENDYNLSVSTYVEAKDTREKIDIVKLNAEIAQIVARENELRAAIDQIVAEIEG